MKTNKDQSGKNNGMFDKHHSEESKRKMSIAHSGKILSEDHRKHISDSRRNYDTPEYRKKISNANRGKIRSEETCSKISNAHKGKRHSKETREKMSIAATKRTGNKNSFWKGGISFDPYCPKFNDEFKERVRVFFNHTCQLCGHVWQEGETRLAVHHVKYNKLACCDNSPRLFVPLCRNKCHNTTSHHREKWDDFFTDKIISKYNGECYGSL